MKGKDPEKHKKVQKKPNNSLGPAGRSLSGKKKITSDKGGG